jgi:hypothetical protein
MVTWGEDGGGSGKASSTGFLSLLLLIEGSGKALNNLLAESRKSLAV